MKYLHLTLCSNRPKLISTALCNQSVATCGCSEAWQNYVAEDEQALLVAKSLERQVDGTPQAMAIAHRTLRTTGWIAGAVRYAFWASCEMQ
jgi:hypothetical protein